MAGRTVFCPATGSAGPSIRLRWRSTLRLHGTWSVLVAGYLATSCSEPTAEARHGLPVVNLTLFAGESLHVATVLRGSPADSAIPRQLRPWPESEVSLRVAADDGVASSLDPAGQGGQYVVRLAVQPGRRYTLFGTVGGTAVQARTTVPSMFEVRAPEGDTVTSADGVGIAPLVRVPYVFHSSGASGYEVRTVTLSSVTEHAAFLKESAGDIPLVIRDTALRRLVFIAYDANAAAWLHFTTPRSSIAGVFGTFGSGLIVRGKFFAP